MTTKSIFATVTSLGAPSPDAPCCMISTAALDRQGDRVLPEGAQLEAYRRNPVVLYGHDYKGLPVGTCTTVEVRPGFGLKAAWTWLDGDPMAARVKNAWDQGVLRAASVGFRPVESTRNEVGGVDYTKWELLEFSLVAVPANPEAVRTLKGLGLWEPEPAASGSDVVLVDGVPLTVARLEEIVRHGMREAVEEILAGLTGRVGGRDGVYLAPTRGGRPTSDWFRGLANAAGRRGSPDDDVTYIIDIPDR